MINKKKIAAFVPIKLNSRRLPNKNFLNLGNRPLAHYIFDTLHQIEELDSVYCYTSQSQIIKLLPDKTKLLPRPANLDGDDVSGNQLFDYAIQKLSNYDVIVLCHPTGPFVEAESLKQGIHAVISDDYDCAIAVEKLRTYAWFNGKPLNYEPNKMAQTQDLQPVFAETSGFYIFEREKYKKTKSRVGEKPAFIEVNRREAVDIDYPSDFAFAEHMLGYDEKEKALSFDRFFVDIVKEKAIHGKIRHYSFDLDGVIIDSIEVMEKSWCAVGGEYNLEIGFDEYKKHIGRPLHDILKMIGVPDTKIDSVAKSYSAQTRLHKDAIKSYPEVVEAIKVLKKDGYLISIVTSKPRERAEEIVEGLFGKDSGIVLVSPEDLPSKRGKPAPDPILLACCLNGCDPQETIYIGDMDVDKRAAKRAAVHFVHASWGYEELPELDEVWFGDAKSLCQYLYEISNAQSKEV
ncbi:acylneuraminate cytidylyltransferase [Paraglaciecola sp. L3A3]|uniref:acylneuraminate cytidylyltransferase n=1 Tax=Paraglaciecola sp. L3A3 TaxID=2686358 RepID=UPI00131DF12F|nr:acylneuraminate cytidylyltransferase [Paraglaciecola sp. L3A3]